MLYFYYFEPNHQILQLSYNHLLYEFIGNFGKYGMIANFILDENFL